MLRTLTVGLVVSLAFAVSAAAQPPPPDPTASLLDRLQTVLTAGEPAAFEPLLAPDVDRVAVSDFTDRWFGEPLTRVAIKERDRVPLPAGGVQLVVEAILERGDTARVGTWRFDVNAGADGGLHIAGLKTLSSLEGLYRLLLDETTQFQVNNLHISAEDLELVIPNGIVFLVPIPSGVTGVVILGRGEMTFRPAPVTERGQIRILAGDEALRTPFDGAFVRLHPTAYLSLINQEALSTMPVDPRMVRDAQDLFRQEAVKSYSVDLADLSSETWWLLPAIGDLLTDVRTRRFGTLTYARAANQAEDITVFDRERRKQISVYPSKARIAARGPFYDEDDLEDVDVLDYSVDVAYAPDRTTFDGRTQLRMRVRSSGMSTLNLKLAASLVVRSVTSDSGRVLFLRVRNQDSLVVNLPATLAQGTVFTLTVAYAGPVEPQNIDTEVIGMQQEPVRRVEDAPAIQPERNYLYTHRSYWYPQPSVSDYAPATIRLTLPPPFGAVCTGELAAGSPVTLRVRNEPRHLYVFAASQPVRYLGCVISRFVQGNSKVVSVPRPGGTDGRTGAPGKAYYDELRIMSAANPRQRSRSNSLVDRAAEIAAFYAGMLQDVPYPSFTLAVLDSHLPGGHSPAYFAALNQPLPSSPFTWRDDPAAFDNFPEFFIAHELAHQWWGQAVGWQNYHEQWLSEGFAQYFAVLYGEHRRGSNLFAGLIRTMNRWAVSMSDQGPIYLGYRLGHLRGDSRVMRAVVYNKGAMVLHMLRRLVGDETFFRSLRRFYEEHRFDKAGTDALREAFSEESGRDLRRFFEQWVYGSDLPVVRWTTRTEGQGASQALVIRIEQEDPVFEFPLTVTLQIAGRSPKDVIVPVTDQVVEQRIPYTGTLRGVQVNRDKAALIRDES